MSSIELPIGTIISLAKDFTGVPDLIDAGFKACDGTVIESDDSPIKGTYVPDLNSGVFLRGNSNSIEYGGSDTHSHYVNLGLGWRPSIAGSTTASGYKGYTTTVSNIPAYYEVVYYMKIK